MGVLSWDEYFMGIALLNAKRSKDPNTKVGSCIVNNDKRIVALGYNGMPHGDDNSFSWERDQHHLGYKNTKYPYVIHAEENAILNSNVGYGQLQGCTMYVTLFPCHRCARMIAQVGIKKVVYLSDKYIGTEDNVISKYILKSTGVEFEQLEMKPIYLE